MLIVSDALKQAFMEPERTIYVRIKIGNRVFDNDDVVSIEYDSGSLSGEVFAIGSTYSNSIKVTFSDLVEGLKELDEVIYEIGIKLPDGTIGYVPMGTFIINEAIEMDRNNNKTIIECMDRMIMMGGAYVSSLTYPAPIREVALEIVNKAGVTVDVTSFERLSADKIAKPEGYTLREAIGLVAQFEAGFATFNRFGKLEIRTLSDPMFAVPPDNYFSKGLVKNEVFFRLGGISCTTDDGDTVIQSGNSAGNQVVLENRVMTKPLLDKIYQKIQTINYYPFSLNWQGNPVLEAGDWIEVEDLQGNKFKTPNLNYSLSFSGGLSAKSSADTTTQSDVTYQYKSPLQQKIEWIQARIDAAGGNVVYEGIDQPANPKEGDLWFKIIGPDKEILVYKKDKDGNLFWDPQISTADINKVAKEMEKIIAQADADRAAAEQNFEQAIADAATYTNTKAQELDNQLIIVNQDLIITKQSANNAVTQANKAIEDAGFAKVDAASAKQTASAASGSALEALGLAQQVNANVNTLTTNYDALTQTVSAKAEKATVEAVSGIVNRHTNEIAANAEALKLRLTSAQVDNLVSQKGYATTNQLTATSGTLTSLITGVQTNLDNLEIGGCNYFKNSDKEVTGLREFVNSIDWDMAPAIDKLGVSQTYTISFDLKSAVAGSMQIYAQNGSSTKYAIGVHIIQASTEYQRFSITFEPVKVAGSTETRALLAFYGQGYGTGRIPSVKNVKFEVGNKATDWSPAPEDQATKIEFTELNQTVNSLGGRVGNSEGQLSALELRVSGIQTTVTDKADKTQVTQLSNQWTQTTNLVNGHTGQISNLGTQINLRLTSAQVTEAILADKTVKDTRATNQLPSWYYTNYPKQTAKEFKWGDVIGAISNSAYGLLTTDVPWSDSSGGSITQTFSTASGTYQRRSSSSTAWGTWDKIAEAGKLVSQINLSTEGVLIQGKRIQLDGDVTMTNAFVTDIKAKSLEAVYADIATLKTKVLTADVITSTMVKSDTALITKLFATDANVNVLTAKTAFINSVKAVTISADKVTTGTLNAANVNLINVNVSSLVGNTSNFVQSAWNSAVGGGVSITGSGIITTASDGSQTYIQEGIVGTRNPSGATIGQLGYLDDVGKPTYLLRTSWGSHFKIRNVRDGSGGFLDAFQILSGGAETYLYSPQIYLKGVTNAENGVHVRNGNNLVMYSGSVIGSYGYYFAHGGEIYSVSSNSDLNIKASNKLWLHSNGTYALYFDGGYGYMNRNLSMEGFKITNQSDGRLKKNIKPTEINSLNAIKSWTFVGYDWIAEEGPKERQFGLIAQDTPDLAIYDSSRDKWSIDSSKQVMMNSHAIQQLAIQVDSIENTANARNILADQALSETQQLRLKVKELENKIKQLEEAT